MKNAFYMLFYMFLFMKGFSEMSKETQLREKKTFPEIVSN